MRALVDFIGEYTVSREITDARAGGTSRFEGRAVIKPHDGGAIYTETGTLVMSSQRFAAERSYVWREEAGRIYVAFADGAPFHDFDPQKGGAATEHLCGEDMYRGGYDFSEWSCWAVRWDVSGPRKDYASVTWYVRQTA